MKTLIAFLVCGLAMAGSAQSSLKTFTSSDGLFRFQYADMLVNCAPHQTPTGAQERGASEEAPPGTSISDACVSQGADCDGPGSGGRAMACFAYPKERFKDKPAFVAATFYVSEILSAKTEEVCLKGSPDWFVIKSEVETTTITLPLGPLRLATTGQAEVNPDLPIELFTVENATSWVSKMYFLVRSTIPEPSRSSPSKIRQT